MKEYTDNVLELNDGLRQVRSGMEASSILLTMVTLFY